MMSLRLLIYQSKAMMTCAEIRICTFEVSQQNSSQALNAEIDALGHEFTITWIHAQGHTLIKSIRLEAMKHQEFMCMNSYSCFHFIYIHDSVNYIFYEQSLKFYSHFIFHFNFRPADCEFIGFYINAGIHAYGKIINHRFGGSSLRLPDSERARA